MTSEARPEKRSAGGCLLRLAVVVVVLAAMGATAAMLLRGPLRADPDVNPALDPVRRTVLKLYLSEHAEELAGPAGSGAAPVVVAITAG